MPPQPGQQSMPAQPPAGLRWQALLQQLMARKPGITPPEIVQAIDPLVPRMAPQERQSWEQAKARFGISLTPEIPPEAVEEKPVKASAKKKVRRYNPETEKIE